MSNKYTKEGPINNCMAAVGKCVYWCAEHRWQKRPSEAAKMIGPMEMHINNLKTMLDDYLSSAKEEFVEELRALEKERGQQVGVVNSQLPSPKGKGLSSDA